MRNRLLKTMMLLAFAAASTQALADDPSAVVGRVALAQGQVSVSGDGIEPATAQANWPVTTGEMITTARGARTELQVGSTFIRLDGDSSLEVLQLDEENLRLRLHYGSASIRIVNPEVVGGFELSTPEGRVRMQEPGRLRVDAERVADTSSVTVFEGAARVEGSGASLTVRAGKRADLQDDDVRTVAAARDAFDDWSQERDRYAEAPAATRYVTPEMTGYSDLDRYGSWQASTEYGALWFPTAVAPGWAPYSDGSWVWMDQWGWTWVDNAPWGYAPFHYGRWVVVRNRWAWAPGHREHRPVWAPALVGWVGGSNWSLGFSSRDRHHSLPARGWYPLSPHDRYVPGYRAPQDHLHRLNSDVRPDFRHRAPEPRGVTIVPQDQFAHHGRVLVTQAPHATVPRQVLQTAPGAAPPPPPPGMRERDARRADEHRRDERPGERFDRDRFGRDRFDRRGDERAHREQPAPVITTQPNPVIPEHRQPPQPVTVLSAPPVLPGQGPQPPRQVIPEHRQPPQPVAAMSAPPVIQPGQPIQTQQPVIPEHRQPPQPVSVLSAPPAPPTQQAQPLPPQRLQWRHEKMEAGEEPRRERPLQAVPGPVPAAVAPPMQPPMPGPAMERARRGDFERRADVERREPAQMPPPVRQAPPPVAAAQPAPPPLPPPRQMQAPPAPAMQAPPPPRPAPAGGPPPNRAGRDDNVRAQER